MSMLLAPVGQRVERVEPERRDVHDHRRDVVGRRQPAPAFERQLDLAHALVQRTLELLDRLRPQHAVGQESLPGLEALHGLDELGGVDGVPRDLRILSLRQVAGRAQAAAQRGGGVQHAPRTHVGRDRRQLHQGRVLRQAAVVGEPVLEQLVVMEPRLDGREHRALARHVAQFRHRRVDRRAVARNVVGRIQCRRVHAPARERRDEARRRDREAHVEAGAHLRGGRPARELELPGRALEPGGIVVRGLEPEAVGRRQPLDEQRRRLARMRALQPQRLPTVARVQPLDLAAHVGDRRPAQVRVAGRAHDGLEVRLRIGRLAWGSGRRDRDQEREAEGRGQEGESTHECRP